MAHFWLRDDDGDWVVLPLDPGFWDLAADPPRRLRGKRSRSRAGDTALLLSSGSGTDAEPTCWLVLTSGGSDLRINGWPARSGICALEDRDELRIDQRTLYFSTERLAATGPFAAGANPLFCPRCKQTLEDDTAAVRCPGCGVWHHQSEQLPCWSYAPTCALCEQSTDLEAGFRWTPEEL